MEKMKNSREVEIKDAMIYGLHPILEALEAGREIDRVLIQKGISPDTQRELNAKLKPLDIPYQMVPKEKMDRITRKNHQGLIAFISPVPYQPLEETVAQIFEKGESPLIIVLDRITDVRNFGAIARTAECAGAHAILIPDRNSVRMNADALKTSAGALNHLPVCRVRNINLAIRYLMDAGLQCIACTEKTDRHYYDLDLRLPSAIILGSEEDGISPDLMKLAQHRVALPMSGKIGSLNVSVAAGVLMYEALRQRTLNE
jgi:23S rRNA (guanosine2251-2'-O)-methyltransferase